MTALPSRTEPWPTSSPEPQVRGFAELDERVGSGAPGVVVARVSEGAVSALLAHVARRVAASGFEVFVVEGSSASPVFHQVACRFGLGETTSPRALAEAFSTVAAVRKVALVSTLPAEGTWDHSVARELLGLPLATLVVLVAARGEGLAGVSTVDVPDVLDDDERQRFLEAMLDHEVRGSDLRTVRELAALAVSVGSRRGRRALDQKGELVLAVVSASACPWPISGLARFVEGPEPVVAALADEGYVAVREGRVHALEPVVSVAVEGMPTGATIGRALVAELGSDPWAKARAAELVYPESRDEAEALHADALTGLVDPAARRDVRRRWATLVAGDGPRVLAAARRALADECFDEALAVLDGARDLGAEHAVVMGLALSGKGDLVGARVALERAKKTDVARAFAGEISAELAEVAYAMGDLAEAEQKARAVVSSEAAPRTLLRARNLLGKLLLAAGSWDEAEAHFASDAQVAEGLGLVPEALRARLNRAIAVQSKGRVDEAADMLRAVSASAEASGETRTHAYALSNLAVVAWTLRDYGTALECLERTFGLFGQLGASAMIAHTVASLADLRLRLGLVENAAQTIAFGRRTGLGPLRAAPFAAVASRIALAKGDLPGARAEMERALSEASASGDVELLGEAHRLSARVHLEEGDIAGCRVHVSFAEPLAKTPRARAEAKLLEAMAGRAEGTGDLSLAKRALRLARTAGDEDVLCEALLLVCQMQHDLGDIGEARATCEQALAVRDKVAEGLPAHVRASFLSRPEGVALARMHLVFRPSGKAEAPSSEPPASAPLDRPSERALVGDDPKIRALLATIAKVARSDSTILVRGESGTGKELVAEAIHKASDRANGPLVSVNCAALVETLLLSELFGHEKGAFTGATARRRGRFELAEGGTLFLDEIGDVSPRTQVALLRVLQEKTFERVGGAELVRANVRVVCATHRDLRAMVERGEFREDLYYRLRGIVLEVPPLRARPSDIPRIADTLLRRIASERSEAPKRLTADAEVLLRAHKWPGNVRELENALRAATLFADGEWLNAHALLDTVEDLRLASRATGTTLAKAAPASDDSSRDAALPDDEGGPLSSNEAEATQIAYQQVRRGEVSLADMKRQIERDCIVRALSETHGNITKAAALLGMKRPRLSQLAKQYGLTANVTEAVGCDVS
jgi:transcriptional regulator with GAF, ATPase, and Fis domain